MKVPWEEYLLLSIIILLFIDCYIKLLMLAITDLLINSYNYDKKNNTFVFLLFLLNFMLLVLGNNIQNDYNVQDSI